jgi:peroxiredoxin
MIQPGQPAPDFNLYDTTKTRVQLSELQGNNVLLLFFPFAFSGVCTKELCSVRDNIAFYNNAHAKIFGISVDSLYSLARFKEEQHLDFSLLSDFNKEVSAAYGSLAENWSYDMKGVAKRSAFVIDKQGIIRYAEILENAANIPDFRAINKVLEELN